MVEVIPTVLAVLTVLLLGVALLAMTAERMTVAGFCFLSASLIIYLRETRSTDGATGS
ncbi:MAG: hypothetical protein V5A44_00430 [Haloarculaceae archaeon]